MAAGSCRQAPVWGGVRSEGRRGANWHCRNATHNNASPACPHPLLCGGTLLATCDAGNALTENRARSNSRLAAQKALARTPATRCTALLPLARSLQRQGISGQTKMAGLSNRQQGHSSIVVALGRGQHTQTPGAQLLGYECLLPSQACATPPTPCACFCWVRGPPDQEHCKAGRQHRRRQDQAHDQQQLACGARWA